MYKVYSRSYISDYVTEHVLHHVDVKLWWMGTELPFSAIKGKDRIDAIALGKIERTSELFEFKKKFTV